MRVCLFLALLIPVTSYNWFDDFGSDEEEVTPSKIRSTTSPIPFQPAPTTTASSTSSASTSSTPTTTTSSATTSTTAKPTSSPAQLKVTISNDALLKTLLHGLLARIETIEDEVVYLRDTLMNNTGESRSFQSNFSIQISEMNSKLESISELEKKLKNLSNSVKNIGKNSASLEQKLKKEIDELYLKIKDEVDFLDVRIEKTLNRTEEGPIDMTRLNLQLKKFEAASEKFIKQISKKTFDAGSVIMDNAVRLESWSDRFVTVFAISMVSAVLVTALLTASLVYCIYRICTRRSGDHVLSDQNIRERALRYGQEEGRRIQITHPHLNEHDEAMQRAQDFVEDIERRRINNDTLESDPNNIERDDRLYEEVEDRSERRQRRSGTGVILNMTRRRAFFHPPPPPPYDPPTPAPRLNPPMPDQPATIEPPSLGLNNQ